MVTVKRYNDIKLVALKKRGGAGYSPWEDRLEIREIKYVFESSLSFTKHVRHPSSFCAIEHNSSYLYLFILIYTEYIQYISSV